MLISQKWLQKYLPDLDDIQPREIAIALTESLAEVEGFKSVRNQLKNIVVGEVVSVEKHPESEQLSVCKVSMGNGTQSIICRAKNVAEGQKVAVCLPGGQIYSPDTGTAMQISAKKIKGIVSQGMICSGKELNINNNHETIMVLEPELKTGLDLTSLLQDVVYEIENKSLSHRSDCFSHEGIARELSALLGLKFKENAQEISIIPTAKLPFTVEVNVDAKICSRFTSIVLSDLKVQESPLWLQAALSAVEVRPINNIVDITNYVMLDRGQPLHAYDYDKLAQKKLVVRYARIGEQVTTLDDKQHKLSKDVLVITDGSSVEDIAAVMGGQKTEISAKTKTIVLEAANFNMFTIRKGSRILGIRTEASTRMEKGLDPNLPESAIKSAIQLITDLALAEISTDLLDFYPDPKQPEIIKLDINLVKRFLGLDLSKQQIIDKLAMLNLTVTEDEKINEKTLLDDNTNKIQLRTINVIVPTYRMDLHIEQDLLEEIARVYGYGNIKPSLPVKDLTAAEANNLSIFIRTVNKILTACGMDEIMTYSFVGANLYDKLGLDINNCVKIKNPLSPELSLLRNSIVPSLLQKAQLNSKNFDNFSFFEIGRAIYKDLDQDKLHLQPRKLGGLIFITGNNSMVYYQLQSNLNNLFKELGLKVIWQPYSKVVSSYETQILQPILHPGRSALISIEKDKQPLGIIGETNYRTRTALNFHGFAAVFELDLETLQKNTLAKKSYRPLVVYPPVKRDLSFWFSEQRLYSEIEKAVFSLKNPLIVNMRFLDLFAPVTAPKKPQAVLKKGITFELTLQSHTKTLKDDQIINVINQVVAILSKQFQAELRSK